MIPILADDDDWGFDPYWDLEWDDGDYCDSGCVICFPEG